MSFNEKKHVIDDKRENKQSLRKRWEWGKKELNCGIKEDRTRAYTVKTKKGETQTINTQGNKARPRPISALMCKEEHRHTVRGLQNDRQWATHGNVSNQTVGN